MSFDNITEEEVLNAQRKWALGVVEIGKKFRERKDYISFAESFLDDLYAYDLGDVLFKPTLASETQFRLSKKAALSYFVSGDSDFSEDKGFALMNWQKIRFENKRIRIESNIAIVMGNYFMIKNNIETKIEYSLVYKKDIQGCIRIILHDSHLPYCPDTFLLTHD